MQHSTRSSHIQAQGGYALMILCRVALLLVVLAQLVYLGNRYRHRIDLTADQLYSLTDSTQRVLDSLEDRLLIECYFTRDDKLPASLQDQRRELRSVLDEYVRRSAGKVQLQFFDPHSDLLLRQKAERLQMQPQVVENLEIGELKQQQIWQGMRLRYGGDRQQMVPWLQFAASTFQYEAQLTPAIKDLTVKVKPKVKVMAPPPQSRERMQKTYRQVLGVLTRYDFTELDLSEGKLVPDDVGITVLFRPRNLSDRDKYALDQFLMRGGKLVVFADTDDVDVGNNDQRNYTSTPVSYDSGASKLKFIDQLACYGVVVDDKMVADYFLSQVGNLRAGAQESMGKLRQSNSGVNVDMVFYPYLFRALSVDWGSEQVARQMAQNERGEVDPERAKQYRAAFKPGMKVDHPLVNNQVYGPGMFWPCPVDLVDKLPEGVVGEIVMRSSPLALVERAPRDVNPFGFQHDDGAAMAEAMKRFQSALLARFQAAPRKQVGLVATLSGTIPSFFAGQALPPRKPVPQKPEPDPLTEKVGKEGEAKADQPSTEPGDPKAPDKAPDGVVGPPLPGEAAVGEDKDKDPPFLAKAAPSAQLVVVGDADFLRDDFVSGAYTQGGRALVYGPVSDARAPLFFRALLDWLIEDYDLVALHNKIGTDRTVRLGQQDVMRGESAEAFLQRVSKKTAFVQWANVLGPAAFLLIAWLLVAIRRSQRKAAFLRAVGN